MSINFLNVSSWLKIHVVILKLNSTHITRDENVFPISKKYSFSFTIMERDAKVHKQQFLEIAKAASNYLAGGAKENILIVESKGNSSLR